ncbi:class I SAM-dependent methyltransferase [Ekhidna sp. To15]|uniref:class I SAM-dependent methyltransferase n=1 Tax=Ekhidna sp. To15 TaxID=3395267 RepID=UPI003F520032
MAVNDFNRIAQYYNRVSKLIFGNQLLKAQTCFLAEIKPEDQVLILGGGTGEFLEYLPPCQKIHFVEMSSEMLKRASSHTLETEIEFINIDFLKFQSSIKYDFIICPFFLDCFNEENLNHVLAKIKPMLKPDGLLLVADFRKTKSNSLLLAAMHLFFHIFANLEAEQLLDIDGKVTSLGFMKIKEKISHRNQLFSRLYRNL